MNPSANQEAKLLKKSVFSFLSIKSIFGIFRLPNIFTADIKRGLRLAKEAKTVLADNDSREVVGAETFGEMVIRLGLSETELTEKTKVCRIQSVIYGSAMFIFVMWTVFLWTIPGIFSGLCAIIISGSLWFRWSLRLWRLRERNLGSYQEFLATDWYLEWLK